jgi:hypothetical protein
MALAMIVLSPPSSYPEAFLDFFQQRFQVSSPVLFYSQANLEVSAKRLSDMLQGSAVVYMSRWSRATDPKEYLTRLREESGKQGQDCVFILSSDQMDQLCSLEAAERGTLALGLSPHSGPLWTVTRSDFQAYLHVRMGESWRGEPLPQLNLQMHLAVMRESILAGVREELKKQPGNSSAMVSGLETRVEEEVKRAAERIEEMQRLNMEKTTAEAMRAIEEAQSSFEAGRTKVETQVQTLMQEQAELIRLLTEANEALRSSKLLKDKVNAYEETNKAVQQMLRAPRKAQEQPQPPPSRVPAAPSAMSKPSVPSTNPIPVYPPITSKSTDPPANPIPTIPPITSRSTIPSTNPIPTIPPGVSKPSVSVPYNPQPGPDPRLKKSNTSEFALTEKLVEIKDIEEGPAGLDALVVKISSKAPESIEGAEMVYAGPPLRPLPDKIPILPPGPSQFHISMNCLPEDVSFAHFFLRKDGLPISTPFEINLGVEGDDAPQSNDAVPSIMHAASFDASGTGQRSFPKAAENIAGLTADQTAKYRKIVALIGSSVQPNIQERIKRLVVDPANAGKQAEQLLDLVFT